MSRIFKSKIYQTEDGVIDAKLLFEDIEKFLNGEKERIAQEEGISIEEVKIHRWHPLQSVLNKTSGRYLAPTAVKSFDQCPANYLYSKLVQELRGSATSVGTSFHTVMQRFYDLSGEERTEEKIYEITEKVIKEDEQDEKAAESIRLYVKGYLEANDYLTGRPMDHKNLICSNEVFLKPEIKPLGVDLGVPVYELIDRIDIRDDGIYVIDYKTGFGDPTNDYLLGEHGYLPQFIYYAWGIEAEYGQPVKEALMALPGADSQEFKYIKMNVHSLVEQSKVVEKAKAHLDSIHEIRETKQFPSRLMRYCGSCQMKTMCATYIKSKGLDESNIKTEIEIEMTIEDSYGDEEKEEEKDE